MINTSQPTKEKCYWWDCRTLGNQVHFNEYASVCVDPEIQGSFLHVTQ